MNDIVIAQVLFRGRVQGVAFRYTTARWAHSLGVLGTVRNVPDGTVELVAMGSRDAVDSLIEKLRGDDGPGHVYDVVIDYAPARGDEFSDFRVV